MKLPDLGSTSPPDLVPDIGENMGTARDAALDAAAREGMAAPLPDYEAPPDLVGVDEAIEVGRAQMAAEREQRARMMTAPSLPAVRPACATCGGAGWIPRPAIDPQLGILGYDVCPGCGGTKESER